MKGIFGVELNNGKNWSAFGIITVFFVLVLLLDIINGRFWMYDFKVYFMAASALFNGETVYGVPFGLDSGFYKYSPFVLFFFYPLTLLPYLGASVIFFIFLSVLNLKNIFNLNCFIKEHLFPDVKGDKFWLFALLTFVIAASHIHRELHLGNINVFLLVLFVVALKQIGLKENFVGGCLIGLGLLFKPHFLIVLPLLFLWKKWRVLLGVAIALFIGFVVPGLMFGWVKNIQLHRFWFHAISDHNADIMDGINTIYYYPVSIYNYLGLGQGKWLASVILFLIAGVVGVLHFYAKIYAKKKDGLTANQKFEFEYLLLIGLIPSLTITDTEHFLLSMPLIVFCLYAWAKKTINNWTKSILIMGFLLYGANWGDLIGEFSQVLNNRGVLGLGNLIILGVSVFVYLKVIRKSLLV